MKTMFASVLFAISSAQCSPSGGGSAVTSKPDPIANTELRDCLVAPNEDAFDECVSGVKGD